MAVRVCKPLPGVDKVFSRHLFPVRPLGAAELKAAGNRTVCVFLRLHALGHAIDYIAVPGLISHHPHQVLIEMNQYGLTGNVLGVYGVQCGVAAAHAHREFHAALLLAAARRQ